MCRKFVLVFAMLAWCLHSYSQGWKFNSRADGIQEMMANSTVRLDIVKPLGKWTGTGVLFHFFDGKDPTRQIQVVLTARHLVADASIVTMTFPMKFIRNQGKPTRGNIKYTKGNIRIESHPDTNVDLCAIIISAAVNELRSKGKELIFSFDTSVLADDKFYEKERPLDPVVMVGHPVGLMDEVNYQPIFRRGVYATNPSIDYMGRKEFLLDIPNNGGSSGSPVFRFDDKMYNDRTGGGVNMIIGSRLVMVGMSFDNGNTAVLMTGPSNCTAWVIKTSRIKELGDMMIAKLGK